MNFTNDELALVLFALDSQIEKMSDLAKRVYQEILERENEENV